jgi:ArsR family transcriptional regulator, arsenate/arsenite/antimonite-responsive transcriptional repressor
MPKTKTEGTSLDMETLAEAFKALSNKNRLSIFEQIRSGCGKARLDGDNRLAVCAVASAVCIAPSTISHHIKELRRAHLVICERRGQTIL